MGVRTTVAGLAAVILSGCYSKDAAPVMSHGQPVAHWVDQLKNPDAKQRKHAVTALGHVGAADPLVVPALIGAVKDKDAGVRDEAVLARLRIGPAAIGRRHRFSSKRNETRIQTCGASRSQSLDPHSG